MLKRVAIALLLILLSPLKVQAAGKSPEKSNQNGTVTRLHFGSDATYPPLVSLTLDGKVSGFETELLQTLCDQRNWTCEFSHEEWDNLIPALETGKIDAIYGGIAITEARRNQFDFSLPLFDESLAGLIFQTQAIIPFTQEGLANKTLGVQTGSTFSQYLNQTFPDVKVKRYVGIQDAFLDLNAKRIDAVFGDTPVLRYFKRSLPLDKQNRYTVIGVDLNPENLGLLGLGYGVAFKRSGQTNPLLSELNAEIRRFQDSPEYDRLKLKYGIQP